MIDLSHFKTDNGLLMRSTEKKNCFAVDNAFCIIQFGPCFQPPFLLKFCRDFNIKHPRFCQKSIYWSGETNFPL